MRKKGRTELLPEGIPSFSVGPFIGLVIHAFLALGSFAFIAVFRRLGPFAGLSMTYLCLSAVFLGQTLAGYWAGEEKLLWAVRLTLAGLAWLPAAWIWYARSLIGARAGLAVRLAAAWAAAAGLIVLFIDHPLVLTGPVSGLPGPGFQPGLSRLMRPLLQLLAFGFGLVYGPYFLARRAGKNILPYAPALIIGQIIWILGGANDAIYYRGWYTPLGGPIMWLASIWFSLCLTLVMASRYRRMEEALASQRQDLAEARGPALLGQAAARVVHQVSGFLNKLVFGLTILKAEPLGAESRETLATLEKGALSLSQFMRRFMALAGQPRIEPRPVSVRQALERAVSECRPSQGQGGAEVVVEDKEGLQVLGDWALLNQALVNLLQNALKAAGAGGRVLVRAGSLNRSQAEIVIQDDGPGLDGETLARIFDPFPVRGNGQDGLGLALSKKIVEAHGGSIQIDSTPGRGTSVRLVLAAGPGLGEV